MSMCGVHRNQIGKAMGEVTERDVSSSQFDMLEFLFVFESIEDVLSTTATARSGARALPAAGRYDDRKTSTRIDLSKLWSL